MLIYQPECFTKWSFLYYDNNYDEAKDVVIVPSLPHCYKRKEVEDGDVDCAFVSI